MQLKRLILFLLFMTLPTLAHAQYQHASFFNGGTTLTSTCTAVTGTIMSQDYFEGTLQGSTTTYLPPIGAGCLSGDIIRLKPTQAASASDTLTVSSGTNTQCTASVTPWACCTGSGTGTCTTATIANNTVPTGSPSMILKVPTGASSGAANNADYIFTYNSVATTAQWEYATQETQPATPFYPITTEGSSGAANVAATDVYIICNTGGNTLTLPASSASSRVIWFYNPGGSGNNCTISRAGSDHIDNSSTTSIVLPASTAGTTYSLIDSVSGTWHTFLPPTGMSSQNAQYCAGNSNSCLLVTNGGALTLPGLTGISTLTGFVSTTTGAVSTTTGAVGPTAGGVLQSYGGTLPTCACTGGSPTCAVAAAGSNSAGQIQLSGGTGVTTCTLTFSASGAFHAAPICIYGDANASTTPLAYSAGATSTTTAVVDFASATAANINYHCIGH